VARRSGSSEVREYRSIDWSRKKGKDETALSSIVPIQYWIQAYESRRYHVRLFAFSEYFEIAQTAAKNTRKKIIGIEQDSFFKAAQKPRTW